MLSFFKKIKTLLNRNKKKDNQLVKKVCYTCKFDVRHDSEIPCCICNSEHDLWESK